MSYSLGQTAIAPTPDQSENAVARFFTVGQRLFSDPRPGVEYSAHGAALSYGTQPPLNQNALIDYAKVTAVGTFIGVPAAFLLGRWLARR